MRGLWRQAAGGDREAEEKIFKHLLERFTLLAGLLICKEDAEDIAHEACSAVLKEYKMLKNPYDYSAWAHRILKNKIANYFQRRSVEKKIFSYTGETISDDFYPAVHENRELMPTLIKCLRRLIKTFPRYARVLNLVQLGYNTGEICRRMDISRNNLYVLLNRGRKILKECLADGDGKQ